MLIVMIIILRIMFTELNHPGNAARMEGRGSFKILTDKSTGNILLGRPMYR
jgi:hypothetical protein